MASSHQRIIETSGNGPSEPAHDSSTLLDGDLLDGAFAGRVAVIDAIQEEDRGTALLSVFRADNPMTPSSSRLP
jgi:hypothetical protein